MQVKSVSFATIFQEIATDQDFIFSLSHSFVIFYGAVITRIIMQRWIL